MTWKHLVGLAVLGLASCKDDECRNYEIITVTNAVTGVNESHRAGWCRGTITCDDRTVHVDPFKVAYGYGLGPCNRGYLTRYGGSMPSNCRDLHLEITPICLEDAGAAGPQGATVGVGATVGATSGGDWPLDGDGDPEE